MSQIKRVFHKDKYQATYTVNSINHNKRLDQFLQIHFESFSRQRIKQKIASGDIEIRGRNHKLKASTRVKEHEIVIIQTFAKDEELDRWNNEEIKRVSEIEIIHDNKDFTIINKPAFMATHPTGKHLFYCATVFLESQLNSKFYSVHRLDRETSGIMMLSKNAEHSKIMTPLFENRLVKKAYFLIAHKNQKISFPFFAKERLGTEDGFIPNLYTHCYPENSSKGKTAETYFELICENEKYIAALAFPKTGRQHQIRAHAAHHGFPLVGDKLYNGDPTIFSRFKDGNETDNDILKMIIPRHALHAIALKIPSPIDLEFQTIIEDFEIPHGLDLSHQISISF